MFQRRTGGPHGVASATRRVLDSGLCRRHRLGDCITALAEHHDRLGRRQWVERRQHMSDHRPAGDLVHDLGQRGPHPGPLARGKNDGGERRLHRRLLDHQLRPPETVARVRHSANTQIVAEYDAGAAMVRGMSHFLLLFDLDGTLVDTLPDLTNAVNEALREHGYEALQPQQVRPMIGDGMAMLLTRAFTARGGNAVEAEATY